MSLGSDGVPSTQMLHKTIVEAFTKASQLTSSHQSRVQILTNVYNKFPMEVFQHEFLKCINVILQKKYSEDKNTVTRSLVFGARFCGHLVLEIEKKHESDNDGAPFTHPFVESLIEKILSVKIDAIFIHFSKDMFSVPRCS